MEKILSKLPLTSAKTIAFIKHHEGFKSNKYKCAAGYFTIGYGHKLLTGEIFDHISIARAEQLLHQDIMKIEKAVLRNIQVPLNVNQFEALVSFTYNVGSSALQRSTLRQKLNRSQFEMVELELLRWIHIRGVKIKGLISRRQAEVKLFYS